MRRGQRQRGRQYCTLAAREREATGGEEKMEEDMEMNKERMEEDDQTSGETAGQLQ